MADSEKEEASLSLYQVNLVQIYRGMPIEGITKVVAAFSPSDAMAFVKPMLAKEVRVESAELMNGIMCSDGCMRELVIGEEINPEGLFLESMDYQIRGVSEKTGKRYKLIEVHDDGTEEVKIDSL